MKRLILVLSLGILCLASCEGWSVQPLPYFPATPFPSPTPFIFSPTPIILPLPFTATSTTAPTTSTASITPTAETPSLTPASPTGTPQANATSYQVIETDILSCSTGLDILHGMGEVINAMVKIKNTGAQALTNVCATLNALNEGRVHPDKTQCVPSLPAGTQITLKLTVDTTEGKDSPIQVNVTSESVELQRVGKDACGDFASTGSDTEELTPLPIVP